jgi:ribosomal-protein-alanine N-acetyltransferase
MSGKMSEIHLRPFALKDVAEVAALEAACNPVPWSAETLTSYAGGDDRKLGVVAEAEGRIVGYIVASRAADEGEVLQLGVAPERRRQGIAAALIRDLFVRLKEKGTRSVFLEVRRGNVAAIGLYRRLGFGQAGERKGYYRDTGEDALLFAAFLK